MLLASCSLSDAHGSTIEEFPLSLNDVFILATPNKMIAPATSEASSVIETVCPIAMTILTKPSEKMLHPSNRSGGIRFVTEPMNTVAMTPIWFATGGACDDD